MAPRLKSGGPVLGDGGRLYKGLGADMVPAMYNLCSKANLIVPNVTEAALLLGDPLPGVGSSEQAAEQAARLTRIAPQVVVTGVTGLSDGRCIGCGRGPRRAGILGQDAADPPHVPRHRGYFSVRCWWGAFCRATCPRPPCRRRLRS